MKLPMQIGCYSRVLIPMHCCLMRWNQYVKLKKKEEKSEVEQEIKPPKMFKTKEMKPIDTSEENKISKLEEKLELKQEEQTEEERKNK